MSVGQYVKNIVRYWWIVLLAAVAAGAGAAALDSFLKPSYSGYARVVLRPSDKITDTRTLVDMVGQIGLRYLTGTFAQTFTSQDVKAAAQKSAGLSATEALRYPLQANVLPDTVVIEVSGTGPDPDMLTRYLNATVDATIQQGNTLFGVVELQTLESAKVPPTPVSPKPLRDITLGLVLGLLLGCLLAWSYGYLREIQTARQRTQISESFLTRQAEWDERIVRKT